jgi:hypothetical protein
MKNMRDIIDLVENHGKNLGSGQCESIDIVAFHGTNRVFDRFDADMIGSKNDSGFLGRGFYFSSRFETARSYALEKGGLVLKCHLSLRCPYRWHSNGPVEYRNHHYPGGGTTAETIRAGLINLGTFLDRICGFLP